MQRHMPLGYGIVDGRAEIIPEAAIIVKEVFQKYLNGISTYRIAKILTEQGILNASHKPSWNHCSVGKILENTKYMGDGFYPTMIDKETFEQVQLRRREKAESLGRTTQLNSYANASLLGSRLYCGVCGEPYRRYVEHSGRPGETVKWKCKHYIQRNRVCCRNIFLTDGQIKDAFIRIINRVLTDPALLERRSTMKPPAFSPASAKLTRQMEQALQTGEYTAGEIKRLALERAAQQYLVSTVDDWQYQTDKLKTALNAKEVQTEFNETLFIETIKKIMIYEDGRLQFILQNGLSQEINIHVKKEADTSCRQQEQKRTSQSSPQNRRMTAP